MIEKLRQLKKKSHMTNQQIAEKSNIPESTVARIFSGKTPNPTIATVISMARAMGGTVADLLDEEDKKVAEYNLTDNPELMKQESNIENETAEDAEVLFASDDKISALSELIDKNEVFEHTSRPLEDVTLHEKFYEDIINLYKNELKKKDVWITRLFWCLAGIMMFVLFVLIFDILNPGFGFVKY